MAHLARLGVHKGTTADQLPWNAIDAFDETVAEAADVRADGEIALLDWDDAGPRLVASELLGAALSFAGGPVEADEACVLATIESHLESDGPPVIWSDAGATLVEEGFRVDHAQCMALSRAPQRFARAAVLRRLIGPKSRPEVAGGAFGDAGMGLAAGGSAAPEAVSFRLRRVKNAGGR